MESPNIWEKLSPETQDIMKRSNVGNIDEWPAGSSNKNHMENPWESHRRL